MSFKTTNLSDPNRMSLVDRDERLLYKFKCIDLHPLGLSFSRVNKSQTMQCFGKKPSFFFRKKNNLIFFFHVPPKNHDVSNSTGHFLFLS
jgi:hypothetical protein